MNYFRKATDKDKDFIIGLYHSYIGTPGCTWSEEYPDIDDVQYDIDNNSLYCMCDDEDNIIAVTAAGPEEDLAKIVRDERIKNPCMLSRVAVVQSMRNRGFGAAIIKNVIGDVQRRGFDGIGLLVSKTNISAIALYEKLGFHRCGEINLYERDWFCYELYLTLL